MFIGGSMMTMVYYIPLWFQAIKGVTAVQSGINTMAFVLPLVVASIIAGGIITKTGWYNPWMIGCPVIMAIGSGLIVTFSVDTGSEKWIGYLFLFGFGLGIGMQQSGLAISAVLSPKDVSTGVSLMFFAQSLGGAIFICVGQSVFANGLISGLAQIPNINPKIVLEVGATDLRNAVLPMDLPAVLDYYNRALTEAFTVALAVACAAVIPAIGVEWKNIKGLKRGGPSSAATEDAADSEAAKTG
jgi:MFS family permease